MVYGHLHIPRTTFEDGTRFEEVSLGYPREWQAPQPGQAVAAPDPARAGVIERLLPDWVRAVDTTADASEDTLWPAERAVLERAVPKRRIEFATVRVCARAALAELGVPPAAILPGPRGAPGWPPGIVGSMTHCAGYRGAAVARQRVRRASIGIDAEPHGPLPDGVLAAIARPEEHRLAGRARGQPPGRCTGTGCCSA